MFELHWHPPADVVTATINAVPAGAIIAVDADGTLWNIDLGDELVRAAGARPNAWLEPADAAHYFDHLASDHGLASAFTAELAALRSDALLQSEMRAHITPLLRPRAALVDSLRSAMKRGVQVHVVSASPLSTLPVALKIIGLKPTSMIAAVGHGTCRPDPADLPVGTGKVRHWQSARLGRPDLALGDSLWDLPMLQMACVGVMVKGLAAAGAAEDA